MVDDNTNQKQDILLRIVSSACDNASKHYEDSYKSFAAMDSKAQSGATIAGLCLAAVVGFLRPESVNALVEHCGCWAVLLVVLPGAFALASVVLAIRTLRVRKIIAPYGAPGQLREFKLLRELPSDQLSIAHALNFFETRLEEWEAVVSDIDSKVEAKSELVKWTHLLLIISLALLTLLLWQLATSLVISGSLSKSGC
jgi:hypothetical protein